MTVAGRGVGGWVSALPALVAGGAVVAQRQEMQRRAEAVARACHEIRGPLTAAGLAAEAAARRGAHLPPAVLEHELWRAARAVDDLGAAGRSRRGTGMLRDRSSGHDGAGTGDGVDVRADTTAGGGARTHTDAVAVLDRQAVLWTRVGESRGRTVYPVTTIDGRRDGSPALVAVDPIRLAQAIANLIVNALDHGQGDIHLVLRATPGRVRIEVCDSGPGLPEPLGVLIARPRGGRGRRGRGLAITAAIAERAGGRLVVAPAARGARMVLDLPADAAAPANAQQRAASTARVVPAASRTGASAA